MGGMLNWVTLLNYWFHRVSINQIVYKNNLLKNNIHYKHNMIFIDFDTLVQQLY